MTECKIKKGWEDEGKSGKVLGENVFAKQNWTPVLWDGEDDPTFVKTAGLDFYEEYEKGTGKCPKCGEKWYQQSDDKSLWWCPQCNYKEQVEGEPDE